jgi:hypothetical protein
VCNVDERLHPATARRQIAEAANRVTAIVDVIAAGESG